MVEATGSWKTSSGLLDDYDHAFEEVWFSKNENTDSNRLSLHVRGPAFQDGEEVDDELLTMWSCGDGWEAAKGGAVARHKSGKTTFNDGSGMGKLINSVVAIGGDVLSELSSRGESFEADTWKGLVFHFERVGYSFTNRETGEKVEYEVPEATAFLGTIEEYMGGGGSGKSEKKAKGGGKSKKKAPPKSKKKKAKDEDEGGDDSAGLYDALVQFAAQYSDHDEFLADVFDEDEFDHVEDLRADDDLADDVLDEDGRVWTAAQE